MTTLLSMQNVTKEGTIKLEGHEQDVRYVVSGDICFYALRDVMRLIEMKGNACTLATKVSAENKGRHSFSVNMYVVNLNGIFELMAVLGMEESDALHNLATKVYEEFFTPLEFMYVVEREEDILLRIGRAVWLGDTEYLSELLAELSSLTAEYPELIAQEKEKLRKEKVHQAINREKVQEAMTRIEIK